MPRSRRDASGPENYPHRNGLAPRQVKESTGLGHIKDLLLAIEVGPSHTGTENYSLVSVIDFVSFI